MNRETLIANYIKKFKEHNDLEEKMKKSIVRMRCP